MSVSPRRDAHSLLDPPISPRRNAHGLEDDVRSTFLKIAKNSSPLIENGRRRGFLEKLKNRNRAIRRGEMLDFVIFESLPEASSGRFVSTKPPLLGGYVNV